LEEILLPNLVHLDTKQKNVVHAEKCYKFGFHAIYQNCWLAVCDGNKFSRYLLVC
jgi:hypothetical protein